MSEKKKWDLVITPNRKLLDLNIKETIEYFDLLVLFVKKDIITVYKQTILGPIWFIVQPLLSTLVYTFIFGNIAKIPTEGIPSILFYLSGITLWTIFSTTFTSTSNTFTANMSVFGKVYFPRVIIPLSKLASAVIKYGIQFTVFLIFLIYYLVTDDVINLRWTALLLPLYILISGGIGLGFGLIFSALTTKYRDLKFIAGFGIQLLMYTTTVVYPLSYLAKNNFNSSTVNVVKANPMTHIIEGFRYSFLGEGTVSLGGFLYSFSFMILVLGVGILIFNKTEKNFIDTV